MTPVSDDLTEKLVTDLQTSVTNLLARKFIARQDVKAVQFKNGSWAPHQTYNSGTGRHDGERIPWRREDLDGHIQGKHTFGHYLLSKESKCKLFAFDVDLAKTGYLPSVSFQAVDDEVEWKESFYEEADLRAAWLDRSHAGRDYMKLQFKEIAHKLLVSISKELELPCAAAYSGCKGIHVYAFTGLIDAAEAREGAQIVLDSIDEFKPLRGEHFFTHKNEDPVEGYQNLTIEVFPKQNTLDGKDLGNLMRLPLGKNLKAPQEPAFFIDMQAPLGSLQAMDAETALLLETPWTPF